MGMRTTSTTYGISEDLQELQKEVLEGLELPEDDDGDDEKDEAREQVAKGLAAIEELVSGSWRTEEPVDAARPATGGPTILSEKNVLVASGEDSVEDVRHLVFRFQRLQSLSAVGSVDFGRMQALEVLSLSHNQLRCLRPLSVLLSLSEVNLNFNQIEDLSPLFDCLQLTKVFAAQNRVSSIAGLENCQQLQELSLFANHLGRQNGDALEELLETLTKLPRLHSLDLAENGFQGDSDGLIREALPQLELLDGQGRPSPVTPPVVTSVPGDSVAFPSMRERPGTAPVPKPPKPPKPPSEGAGYPSMPLLPGGDLASARRNRMDELLTKQEVSRPESPKEMLKVLTLHGEALKRQLETQHAERENLRFQVRLLETDLRERKVHFLEQQIQTMEAENRSWTAVKQESERLRRRRGEVEVALAELQTATPAVASASMVADNEEDLDLARWECKRLQKRLSQARAYNFQLLQELEQRSFDESLPSQQRAEEEVAALVTQNEEMLSQLRSDLRTAQGAQCAAPAPPARPPPNARRPGADAVDVLTIGAGPDGEDVEWHRKLR